MSLIASLLLSSTSGVVGTVSNRNAELDAAHACLAATTEALLAEGRPEPSKDDRWVWALDIVTGCETEIYAAADSPDAKVVLYPDVAVGGISKRHMLRAEATYYVDGIIREHFEARKP